MSDGKKFRFPALALGMLLLSLLAGCGGAEPQSPGAGDGRNRPDLLHRQRFRTRPPIDTTRNLYEGSLWRGAASWGNLMRDHRARYRGDLVTVTELPKIINVPETKIDPVKTAPEQADKREKQDVDPVVAFLERQEQARQRIEREQNDILRSLDSIELEVVEVLPNGNLRVRGRHPPIFRNRGLVKYLVTLQGIVRPSDVDDNNAIPAPRLSKAEYNVQRLVKRAPGATAALGEGAPAGLPTAGGRFLDRLTNFLTGPPAAPGSGSEP